MEVERRQHMALYASCVSYDCTDSAPPQLRIASMRLRRKQQLQRSTGWKHVELWIYGKHFQEESR